jgi:superfamily II DNA or RNA helicase
MEGRLAVGRFWAFFNLRDETTLTGIANAPWQVNNDRTGLLEGSQLNKELLDELSLLVLASLPKLIKSDDPGWIIEVIPARGQEARCWGDGYLTTHFHELAIHHALIPDQNANLRSAESLKLPPSEASRQALETWARSPARPSDWCHPTAVATPTRRARVERLFEGIKKGSESAKSWLEALVDTGDADVDHAVHAVVTASAYIRPDEPGEESRRRAVHLSRILLDSTGRLIEADPASIFIPLSPESDSSLVRLVHPGLIAQDGVRRALEVIGINEVTAAVELKTFIRKGIRSAEDWAVLWELVREFSDINEVASILTAEFSRRSLSVRTASGQYRPLFQTLLPGSVVPPDRSRDTLVAIDVSYHQAELEVLRRMGAEQAPTAGFPLSRDRLVETYRNRCIPKYIEALPANSSTPQWDYMVFDRETHVGPLEPLRHLSNEGRAAFTEELIRATSDWRPWMLKHETQRIYQPRAFASAAVWAIREEGRLRTSRGITSVTRAWGPSFARWAEIVHVVTSLSNDVTALLGVPSTVEDLTEAHWQDAFEAVLDSTNDSILGDFYAFAARAGVDAPDVIRCRIGITHGARSPGDVVVTHDRDKFAALRDLDQPLVLVSTADASRLLTEAWQLVPSSTHVRKETHWVEEGAAATLADAFPTLRADLEAQGLARAEIVPCLDIFETVTTDRGTQTIHKDFEKLGRRFLWKTDLGLEEALHRIAQDLPFPLSNEEIADLAEGRWKQDRRERLAEIREQPSNEARLLHALGEERLRAGLPIGLLDAVTAIHGDLGPEGIARLMIAVQGDDTLRYLRDDLRDAGLEPPDRWAGSREARMFVGDLGFPDEFAGARAARRDPELVVPGPPDLPPLHDYQERIVDQAYQLLFGDEEHPRGLISLPTGAGKTRVATQALVNAISTAGLASPVLWIAPSDELCEQAVQAWSEVWRAYGSTGELRIGRLWGPTNEVQEAVDGAQVVVATADKLRYRVDSAEYAWLSKATCVVVDEAHTAITPEYTTILRWLGISASGRTMSTRVPLLGLTATPFRGTSEDETKRLIGRFGGRRLDRVFGGEDDYGATYRVLQDMGVLSRVDGEELETGMTIDIDRDLSPEEKGSFHQRFDLPSRMFDKIAKNIDRNRLLLESILSRPDDWPILLFAVSTEHAATMAALLSSEGVSAAAIDYRTEPAIRRRYIDRFRHGDLRVIANFNVLTQGFDAPATRAIYVARPTFSPNSYQQMIGRGLRGPLNGGKDRCLIVNVRDNWITYGDRLAFYEFEHLWKPDGAS